MDHDCYQELSQHAGDLSSNFYSFPRLYLKTNTLREHQKPNKIELTYNAENESRPYVLQPSLFFTNCFPPTIYFKTQITPDTKPPKGLPSDIRKQIFRWKMTTITPNSIRECAKFMNFEIIPSNRKDDNNLFIISWLKHMLCADFKNLVPFRKVNHFPGSFHLGRKDKLSSRLKLSLSKFGEGDFGLFHPKTFILPKDYDALVEYNEANPKQLLIMKPPASARGNGIQVIASLEEIPETHKTQQDASNQRTTLVVQQYISNPCLLRNGYKFDLRIYVLLTSIDPLRVYLHDNGLVRFASSKYDHNSQEGSLNQFMHLTNYFINKKNKSYQSSDDSSSLVGSKWSLKSFWSYLRENHSNEVNVNDLKEQIKDIIIKSIISCETPIYRLSQKYCKNDYTSYELFGFDIILDDKFKPWILEVNITPSLMSDSGLDSSVKYSVIQDMFNIVGYNLPPVETTSISMMNQLFDERLYTENVTPMDKLKHISFVAQYSLSQNLDIINLEGLLTNITQNDLRVIMLAEDELSRCGSFERIFPAPKTDKYLKYYETPRYYNILLNAWERRYENDRLNGIDKLRKMAAFLRR